MLLEGRMADTSPDKSSSTTVKRGLAASTKLQDETLPSTKTELSEHTRQLLSLRYDLLDRLGSGGMGIVYKARDRETGEVLALKILKSTLTDDATLMERFRNELRLARRITHHNVCRIYDFNRLEDSAFISMEFVDGNSLRELLNHPDRLEVPQVLHIARQICAGLGEAHIQGIVHRDLKPENVMLDRFGGVKLMDFGIARSLDTRSTATGSFLGTPAYMAPEQAEGKPVDRRSDIYALGLVLYEMFTGQAAFSGDTPLAVALKQIRDTPPSPRNLQPGLPVQVEYVILKCLCKDPAKRFQGVEEVEAALVAGATDYQRESLPAPDDGTVKQNSSPRFATDLVLFSLIQLLYVGFYLAALAKLERIDILTERFSPGWGWLMVVGVTVSALVGLAIRLYLLTAVAFHYPGLWGNFSRIFIFILVLDELWAMSPFLLAHRIGFGLAFAGTVPLLFLPFSQRTLISLYFRKGPADWRSQKTMTPP
jgi:serine/threonine protein kinase